MRLYSRERYASAGTWVSLQASQALYCELLFAVHLCFFATSFCNMQYGHSFRKEFMFPDGLRNLNHGSSRFFSPIGFRFAKTRLTRRILRYLSRIRQRKAARMSRCCRRAARQVHPVHFKGPSTGSSEGSRRALKCRHEYMRPYCERYERGQPGLAKLGLSAWRCYRLRKRDLWLLREDHHIYH